MNQRRRRIRAIPTFSDQAKAFGCVDAMLGRLAEGWIHEIDGDPVFRNPSDEIWYSIPPALEGFAALWARISDHYQMGLDLSPIDKLAKRLAYAMPIEPAAVARCADLIKTLKRHYRRMDVYAIGSIVRTEMIAQQFTQMAPPQ